jgi:hypothetical protein
MIAILVTAAGLAACGSSGLSGRAGTHRTDGRWSLLRNCVMNTTGVAIDNEVARDSTRAIRVDGNDDLIAGINYEGTFANAEAAARRHRVPTGAAPSRQKTGGWLAISNVAYFLSFASTPPEIDRVTACLSRTYPSRPRWPANVPLSTLGTPARPTADAWRSTRLPGCLRRRRA